MPNDVTGAADEGPETALSANAGWIAGGLVIVGVFLVGIGLWLKYHPMHL
jgi:hypothetical protein